LLSIDVVHEAALVLYSAGHEETAVFFVTADKQFKASLTDTCRFTRPLIQNAKFAEAIATIQIANGARYV
jgi:hypothetical protein